MVTNTKTIQEVTVLAQLSWCHSALSCTCYIPPLLFATCTGLMLPLEDTNATSLITWVVANHWCSPCPVNYIGIGSNSILGGANVIYTATRQSALHVWTLIKSQGKYWGALAPLAPRFLRLWTVTQKTYLSILPCIWAAVHIQHMRQW